GPRRRVRPKPRRALGGRRDRHHKPREAPRRAPGRPDDRLRRHRALPRGHPGMTGRLRAASNLLLPAAGSATIPRPRPPRGSAARAPYLAAPAAKDDITITLDLRAARSILAVLAVSPNVGGGAVGLGLLAIARLALDESTWIAE